MIPFYEKMLYPFCFEPSIYLETLNFSFSQSDLLFIASVPCIFAFLYFYF